MAYAYGGAGKPRPHAPITIGERDFLYDFNGNQVGWDNQKNGSKRRNTWDEDNRLRQVRGPQGITTFAYDQAGQRTVKLGRQGETVYVNQFYVVRNGAIATKHVFAGTGRVASKLQPGTVPSRGGGGRGGGAGGGPPSTPPGQGGGLPPGLEKKDVLPPGQGGVNPGQGRERRSERATERAQDVYKNPTLTGEKPGRGRPSGGAAATEVQGQRAFTGELPGEFLYFYHPDHVGSTSYVTDDKGDIYEHLQYFPFGETWVQEGQPKNRIPYLFTSKELDAETGLSYFGARYYDPRTSVWISMDPALDQYLAGKPNQGVFNSKNLALMSFAYNNPLVFGDADGRITERVRQKLRTRLRANEGDIPHLYKDTLGNITVGVGFLTNSKEAAQKLPFRVGNRDATPGEVAADFKRVRAIPQTTGEEQKRKPASAFRGPNSPQLSKEFRAAKLDKVIAQFEGEIKGVFPGLEDLPEGAQLAIFDIVFQIGITEFKAQFIEFKKAIDNRDFGRAREESSTKNTQKSRIQQRRDDLTDAETEEAAGDNCGDYAGGSC